MTNRLAPAEEVRRSSIVSPPAETALTYVRGALFNPVSLSVMAFAVCVGVGYAGMLGALIAMATFVAIGTSATRYRLVRRQLDKQSSSASSRTARPTACGGSSRRARCASSSTASCAISSVRSSARIRARRSASSSRSCSTTSSALAVSHQRCLDSLRLAGSSDLPARDAAARAASSVRRRRDHGAPDPPPRRVRAPIERLADELEATDELIRLVAQRVACPHLDRISTARSSAACGSSTRSTPRWISCPPDTGRRGGGAGVGSRRPPFAFSVNDRCAWLRASGVRARGSRSRSSPSATYLGEGRSGRAVATQVLETSK